jgi:hypothetical protein
VTPWSATRSSQNFGILPYHHTVSESRRHNLNFHRSEWKPQNLSNNLLEDNKVAHCSLQATNIYIYLLYLFLFL